MGRLIKQFGCRVCVVAGLARGTLLVESPAAFWASRSARKAFHGPVVSANDNARSQTSSAWSSVAERLAAPVAGRDRAADSAGSRIAVSILTIQRKSSSLTSWRSSVRCFSSSCSQK